MCCDSLSGPPCERIGVLGSTLLFFSFFFTITLITIIINIINIVITITFCTKTPPGEARKRSPSFESGGTRSRCCRPERERCPKITRTRRHVARSERYSRRTSPIVTANLGQVKHTTLYIVNSSAEKKTVTERQS